MFIVVGLGNPGSRYQNTRHNIGFEVLDFLAEHFRIREEKFRFNGAIGKMRIYGEEVILLKPYTYMNNSGECVREVVNYYDIPLQNLVVIYDDIDLELGILRIRVKGSAGTHNGMRSIIYQLQSENFPRVRIGIGRPLPHMDLAKYVLGKIQSKEERLLLNEAVKNAALAVETIVSEGINSAMNKYNGLSVG